MDNEIDVQVRLFGAFRDYRALLRLRIPQGTTVAQLKARIGQVLVAECPGFRHHALLEDSAIGSPRAVLAPSTSLTEACELAVLPPVCGG